MKREVLFIIMLVVCISCGTSSNKTSDTANSAEEVTENTNTDPANKIITPCNENDSLILLNLYDNTGGENWINKWDLSSPVQNWHGIKLNEDGRIISINLKSNNLSGTLPESLSQLLILVSFDLSGNDVFGVVFIPEDIMYENDTIYTKYTFNDIEPLYEEDQINSGRVFNYCKEGLDVYIDYAMLDESIYGYLEWGEEIFLMDDFISVNQDDTLIINGFKGRMLPLEYDIDTMYVFSGYLSGLIFPEYASNFAELFNLNNSFSWETGHNLYQMDNPVFEEMSTSESFEFYENGIIRNETHEYEGGGENISFPKDKFSFQEVYLFADKYYDNRFSEKLGNMFPTEPMNELIQEEDYHEAMVVEFSPDGKHIKSILIGNGDSGYIEEYFIIDTGEYIEVGYFGGS